MVSHVQHGYPTDRKAEAENSALFVKVTRERDLIYKYSVQNRWRQAVITAGKKITTQ